MLVSGDGDVDDQGCAKAQAEQRQNHPTENCSADALAALRSARVHTRPLSPAGLRGATRALCAYEGRLWRSPHPQTTTKQNRPRHNHIRGPPRSAGARMDPFGGKYPQPAEH